MKATVLFLTAVFAFPLFSYGEVQGNLNNETPEEEKPADRLYITGGVLGFDKYSYYKLVPPEELVCTEDGIQSYNLTTKEIIFTDSVFNIILNYIPIFNFYLNDNLLLENIVQLQNPEIMSYQIFDLLLYLDRFFTGEQKFYRIRRLDRPCASCLIQPFRFILNHPMD